MPCLIAFLADPDFCRDAITNDELEKKLEICGIIPVDKYEST
jgi:hypothetical protein